MHSIHSKGIKMAALTLSDIKNNKMVVPIKMVMCPEFADKDATEEERNSIFVWVKGMTTGDAERYGKLGTRKNKKGDTISIPIPNFRQEVAIRTMCKDESGELMCDLDNKDECEAIIGYLSNVSVKALKRIFKTAMELSDIDIGDEEKN